MVKPAERPDGEEHHAEDGVLRAGGRLMHDRYFVPVEAPAEANGPWQLDPVLATLPAGRAFRPLAESRCPLARR